MTRHDTFLRFYLGPLLVLTLAPAPAGGGTLPRRPGTILYELNEAASPAQAEAAAALLSQLEPLARVRGGANAVESNVFRVAQLPGHMRAFPEEDVCAQLMATGGVAFAEPDYLVPPADTVPNDPAYASQWHHSKMACPAAWDLVTGDGSLLVAVIDTGVQSNHPDLSAHLRLPGRNTVDNSTNTEPIHFHGTHVAGCMAAIGNNAVGVTGVAWNVDVLPIKISNRSDGSAYIADMAEGIEWAADQGAKVLNLSYGGFEYATINAAAQ